MKKIVACAMLLFALTPCMPQLLAETIEVRIRIWQKKSEEKIITRGNLIKIQQFILQHGKTETYCNMYNNNPTYQTKNYRFYLNPDTGQENINCNPKKSKFHNFTIRKSNGKKNQYRTVEFLDKHYIYITTNWPTNHLTVQQIRQFVVDAMEELLAEINKKGSEQTGCT